ncbi:right-handed parallel beta-helix repeat-containing protein [Cryptosporangium arvum]|uniref:right-handed parallel beta-helix repeat-containing protein n=1 Tax=Cryptosporangium arvum TaxID=80871 RepID=UPI0004AEF54B|nr:right-handed parallel beta-helix repeat-containing protein [Cryptosporangium arvum]
MRLVLAVVLAAAAVVLTGPGAASAAPGRTFHLSPLGDDAADGLSDATAWRTLARANQERLQAGDQLLLQGGAQFDGQLLLMPEDAGVTIGTYGTGRATIKAGNLEAIKVYDAGGITIRGLDVVGDATTYDAWSGILFYADDKVATRPSGILISDVDVSGFQIGIAFAGAAPGRGFQDVTIADTRVHGNRDEGLLTYGPEFDATNPSYAHRNVRVQRVAAYDNAGNPRNTTTHSGSGIVLGSVDTGVIEESSAYANGASSASSSEGPVGIWAYDSTGVTIQRNLAYRNRTGTTADGGGFDLDQNTSNSTLQYNLSYENDGPGLLVFTARDNTAHRANTVRFNVSVNDVRGNGWYGALTVAGRVADTAIYHNTIVARPGGGSHRPAAVKLMDGLTGVTLRNNLLLSQSGGAALSAPDFTTEQVLLRGNAYFRAGGGATFEWGGAEYRSLADWRKATGEEKYDTGLDVDPKLQDASATPRVTDPARITDVAQFALAGDSPAAGVGENLDLADDTVDYFGAVLADRPVSIGAAQPASVPSPARPAADRGRLWAVAFTLLTLVGLTVLTAVVRRRRRPPPPVAPETIRVPSSRVD